VHYGLGTVHALREEYEQAIQWFDRAIAICPSDAETYFNKALAHQRQLDLANAVRAYRMVVTLGDPRDEFVSHARSFLDGMAKEIRRSHGIDLDAFLAAQTAFDEAFALMERGEWSRALEGFRACAAMNERSAPTYGNMGLCYAQLGRKADALAALARALEIDPRYEPAIINRRAVERIEEGGPPDVTGFVSVDYAKEQVLADRRRRRS
jgi:tetratricopeptide (TPR) repeat protein